MNYLFLVHSKARILLQYNYFISNVICVYFGRKHTLFTAINALPHTFSNCAESNMYGACFWAWIVTIGSHLIFAAVWRFTLLRWLQLNNRYAVR